MALPLENRKGKKFTIREEKEQDEYKDPQRVYFLATLVFMNGNSEAKEGCPSYEPEVGLFRILAISRINNLSIFFTF